MLHNMEVLAVQLSKVLEQIEHVIITMERVKKNLRRSSMSSISTSRAESTDDEDEDVSESEDQIRILHDIRSDLYHDLINAYYLSCKFNSSSLQNSLDLFR